MPLLTAPPKRHPARDPCLTQIPQVAPNLALLAEQRWSPEETAGSTLIVAAPSGGAALGLEQRPHERYLGAQVLHRLPQGRHLLVQRRVQGRVPGAG